MINFQSHFIPLALIVGGGILLTVGDVIAKKWVEEGHTNLYLATMALYMISMNFLIFSFHYKHIAVASLMMVLLNVLLLVWCSKHLWNEPLTTQQVVGVFLGIVALVLLEFEFKKES